MGTVRVLVAGPYNDPRHKRIDAKEDDVIEVAGGYYEQSLVDDGYVTRTISDAPSANTEPASVPAPTFDASVMATVGDVEAWLAEDPTETVVLEALEYERANKNRVTAIDALRSYLEA